MNEYLQARRAVFHAARDAEGQEYSETSLLDLDRKLQDADAAWLALSPEQRAEIELRDSRAIRALVRSTAVLRAMRNRRRDAEKREGQQLTLEPRAACESAKENHRPHC